MVIMPLFCFMPSISVFIKSVTYSISPLSQVSISSRKRTEGAKSRAKENPSAKALSGPTYLKSLLDTQMKVASNSFISTRPVFVFPVPGGPMNNNPLPVNSLPFFSRKLADLRIESLYFSSKIRLSQSSSGSCRNSPLRENFSPLRKLFS